MYASIQYLLAGLPVVSTPSVGGRDLFFGSDTALIVEPTVAAVRAGVAEMVRRQLPPTHIRQRALARVDEHRRTFIARVQRVYDEAGVRRSFAGEFATRFYNRLLTYQRHTEVIGRLR